MTEMEYQILQDRFRAKLDVRNPYRGDRYEEAYRDGIRAAMSILKQEYTYHLKEDKHHERL